MVPATVDARLHHVSIELVGASVELREVGLGGHAATMRGQPRTEHVRDEYEFDLFADRARDGARSTEVLRGANQLGMRVAHLIAA